jgi:putative tricarboxylic transport membrane protein
LSARIRSPRDFFSGVILLLFGLCAVLVGRDYPMGTALRMGAGYFPFVLGALLLILGAVICIKSLVVAGAQTSFIPLLTLGSPNAVMALMVGAMTIHGITPGPQVMTEHPELFWGMIASMWIGNLMLVILNLPWIGIWVKLFSVPYRFLYPAILLFCCIGVCSLNNGAVDVGLALFFGLLGYLFIKLDCEPAPLLLGFVLGPMMEDNLRRAMQLSRGNPGVFLTRALSLAFLLVALALLIVVVLPAVRKKREEAFQE